MRKWQRRDLGLVVLAMVVACGDDDGASDAASDAMMADATAQEDTRSGMPDTGADDTGADDTGGAVDGGGDLYSGVYNVDTVTCGGMEVPIMVMARVTFDGTSYLEEWTLPGSECEVTFAGTVEPSAEQITLRDVEVTCAPACDAIGFCDPTHCSADQTYQYTRTGDELLLSFTQQGDEFSCGPCGDGVASTYLLIAP